MSSATPRPASSSAAPPWQPASRAAPRILVVEDDADLAFGLKNNLEIDGYEVEVVRHGEQAVTRAAEWKPALIILDLMLPGLDGLQILRALRARDADVRVLILTARGDEADKVRGLRLGADDYVTKPFGLLELLARVETLLRRQRASEASAALGIPNAAVTDAAGFAAHAAGAAGHAAAEMWRLGPIALHAPSRRVFKDGQPVSLRPKEFDLLLELLRHRGAVVTRVTLMEAVWGYSSAVISRTIDTHIAELRRKLEVDAAHPRHIVTLRGIGYRLDE